jgi:hypothetical protein
MNVVSMDVFKAVIGDTTLLALTHTVTIDGKEDRRTEYVRMSHENARAISAALLAASSDSDGDDDAPYECEEEEVEDATTMVRGGLIDPHGGLL